jgi:hypothetical protein
MAAVTQVLPWHMDHDIIVEDQVWAAGGCPGLEQMVAATVPGRLDIFRWGLCRLKVACPVFTAAMSSGNLQNNNC